MANEDKATRYHRLRRRASLASTALGVVFLVVLLLSGSSAWLRDLASSASGGSFFLTVTFYVLLLALASEALQLPLAFYQGVTLERRYGLSTQPTSDWWREHLKGSGVALALGLGAALIVMYLLRWNPQWWWAWATLCFAPLLILLAQLAPVLLLPLFYEVKPLDRPPLAARLAALADRAGIAVLGVFEWRLSDRTRKANAALTGVGRTRRILLSDTLLAEHGDDEIEVILAHELSHHVHGDIWKAIGLQTVLFTTGFFVADRVLAAAAGRFGLLGKGDPAVLPLLLLAGSAVSLLLMPVANAISRAHERRADRYALEMTKNAGAFIAAMKRLAAQNLAEEQPARWVEVLFHSHPSTAARIDAARAWEGRRAG